MTRCKHSLLISASLFALVTAGSLLADRIGAAAVREQLTGAGAEARGISVSTLTGRVTIEGVRFAATGGHGEIARIHYSTGGGLVAPAFAQSGGSYVIEGLKVEQPLVSVSIPSIQIDGASIGKDEWLKLFTFDAGLPARLKDLNVAAARVPLIEIRGTLKAGDTLAYSLNDNRIENVRAGKAERIVTGSGSYSSTSTGMKQEGVIKQWEMRGLDLAQTARVWFNTASDGEKPSPLYESYLLEGMTSTAQGEVVMNIDISKVTSGAVRMRPLKGRSLAAIVTDLMAFAEKNKDKKNTDKSAADKALEAELGRNVLPALVEVMDSFEDDGTSGENMRFVVGEKAKPAATVSIAKFSGSYGSSTVPSGFLLSDLAVKSGDYTAKLAQFGISGFSYAPTLRGMAEAMASGDSDFSRIDPRKLMPRFGSYTLKGFELEGPAPKSPKGVKPERFALKVGQFAMAARDEVKGIPTNISLVLDNLAMTLPETPSEDWMKSIKALGYSSVDVSAKIAAAWNEARKEVAISDISFGGAQMGQIKLSGTLGNIGRDLFEADAAMAQVALMGITAKSASLKVDNAGMAEKLIAMQARQQGRKPDELRSELGMMAAMGIPALLGPSDEAKMIAGAIAKFLAKPKGLSIDLAARNAMGIGMPDMVMASDPQKALGLVTVKASASD
ncbi:MAG TPA: hypothetical protein PLQ11_07080 [Beijerinckiaceae bacterium]|nr:hypothetical protein [Beijerinckiaceae bacterium]